MRLQVPLRVLLGPCYRECLHPGPFYSRMHTKLLPNLHLAKTTLQIFPRLRRNTGLDASQNAMNMRSDGPHCASSPPANKIGTRIKRQYLRLEAHSSQRLRGVRQVPLQGATRRRRRIDQTKGRCSQFPVSASALGLPLRRGAKQYVPAKPIRLEAGILEIRAPNSPSSQQVDSREGRGHQSVRPVRAQ